MNKINILSSQEAQKIAAGEVVERPSSAVKEIIENSIDAGANQISLYIEKAGKQLIRIVDNGCGMSEADAKLCFTNHATSKIKSMNDLEQIHSFGFRGEALATICAVSKITLKTKLNDDELGTKLELANGKFTKEEKVSCSTGTDLAIHNLFYNTPVRKKFLKQDETEWNQILSIFNAFCLSNLNIHFKLYRDNKLILNAPPTNNIKDRTSQLWGHSFAQNLIMLDAEQEKVWLKISGLISNHNFWRYGRQQIFFFVNGRAVKNTQLSKALVKGYLNVLPPARFPAAFIFINVNNELVDVNVHPRKEEVKFAKPVTVENYLQKLVIQTLEKNLTKQLQPKISTANNLNSVASSAFESFTSKPKPQQEEIQHTPIFVPQNFNPQQEPVNAPTLNTPSFKPEPVRQETIISSEPINKTKKTDIQAKHKIIGQLFKTYILIENEDNFLLIDQHAAHERILYEKYLIKFEQKDGTRLMFPEILTLPEHHLKLVLKEKDFFSMQGIELEQFGQDQIAIKTSPPKLAQHSLKELILETIEFILENEQLEKEIFRKKLNEHVHSHMACKMAIKAGDVLTQEQIQKLLNDLMTTEKRFICAHGRPTMWTLSKYQVEKNFKRK